MGEISVGDYIRTKKGFIFRVRSINISEKCKNSYLVKDYKDFFYFYINQNSIEKHSPNIIDLIQVGDYVNGARVVDIDIDNDDEGTGKKYLWCNEKAIFNEDIETIVTKEQFKKIEYKVEV